ncbi:MAG TPA: hypothetical protein VFK38_05195 [Candidatus Limnocylindrales bacterium]|nr:hypothetical protein [Candidatus Limnocylindrales bacterium]
MDAQRPAAGRPAHHAEVGLTEHCARCGAVGRLVVGDGPSVCRVCILAWTRYAVLASGPTITEQVRARFPF